MTAQAVAPTALLTALRGLHQASPADGERALAGLGVRGLAGARTNHVYVWEDARRGPVVVKLYRAGPRDRAGWEWQALGHLAAHGLRDQVPQALWHDPHPMLPALAMTLVPGVPLPEAGCAEPALRAMTALLARIRALPLGPLAARAREDDAGHYLHRITRVWAPQLAAHTQEPGTAELRKLLEGWQEGEDARVLAQPAPMVASRGDSNLLNWLWDPGSGSIAVVDWEFCGAGDAAFDAADLVEHISAREVSDGVWAGLLPGLGVDDARTRRRFAAAQRVCALRWLAVLWRQRTRRRQEFERQVERARLLLG